MWQPEWIVQNGILLPWGEAPPHPISMAVA